MYVLLTIYICLQRSPVVGILTRHDFMPEHILGLHPVLLKNRWKRLRWQRGAVAKYLRSLIEWVANSG
jgi:chloride channel 7